MSGLKSCFFALTLRRAGSFNSRLEIMWRDCIIVILERGIPKKNHGIAMEYDPFFY
jgi:hypothetical protein